MLPWRRHLQSAASSLVDTIELVTGLYTAGDALLPMIDLAPFVRNDNTVDSPKELKIGPNAIIPNPTGSGWRGYFEAIEDTIAGFATDRTGVMMATAPALQGPWTFSPATLIVTPVDTPNWEGNEVSPSSAIVNEALNRVELFFHGGNNLGPRQIGVMFSNDGLIAASFTRHPGNPIITVGTSGQPDDFAVSDIRIKKRPDGTYLGFYTARDGVLSNGRIHRCTGTSATALTKQGVCLDETDVGAWGATGLYCAGWWEDQATGRIHMFLANGDTANGSLGYAYSDDDGVSFTEGAGNPLAQGSGDQATWNAHIGDVGETVIDGDLIHVVSGIDATNFLGAAMRGQGKWSAPLVNAAATREGRFYYASAYTEMSGASSLVSANTCAFAAKFRTPRFRRADPPRSIYTEEGAPADFDKAFYSHVTTGGLLQVFFRVGGGLVTMTSTTAVDDELVHDVVAIRTGAAAWTLYVDGVSEDTDATSVSTSAVATFKAVGNWHPSTDTGTSLGGVEATRGTVSDVITVIGSAPTVAQMRAALADRATRNGLTTVVNFPVSGTTHVGSARKVETAAWT